MENRPGSPSCSKKRKRDLPEEVMEEAVSLLTSMEDKRCEKTTEDEDSLFAKYIAKELKKIKDEKIKAQLKFKVQQLIFDSLFNKPSPHLVSLNFSQQK